MSAPARDDQIRCPLAGVSGNVLAIALSLSGPAWAIDVPPPGTETSQKVAVDSTLDSNFFAGSLDINGTFAPFGSIGENGFRTRVSGNVAWYKFILDPETGALGSGLSGELDLLAGYGWALPRVSIIALAGVALSESVDEGVRTPQQGAKGVVSAYARPTDQTMAYASLSYMTIANFLQSQFKFGVKVPGNFFVGPEVHFSARDHDEQTKVGAHASGLQLGPVALGFSGGWLHDRQMGSGPYVSVNAYASF